MSIKRNPEEIFSERFQIRTTISTAETLRKVARDQRKSINKLVNESIEAMKTKWKKKN